MLVIPAIDLIDGKCVRLLKGDYAVQTIYSEGPVAQALRFQAVPFSRLHVVDLEGARDGMGRNREAIKSILRAVSIPVQIGGGIRSSHDVEQLLSWGADYLILGTIALKEQDLVTEWVRRWGSEHFIISLDMRCGMLQAEGWVEQSAVDLTEMMARIADWGIRQLICTDVDRDGTLEQPNYGTYQELLRRLHQDSFLIAAGGVSSLEQVVQLKAFGVAGAIVGKAIYEGRIPLEELARVS
jgi:phosphoribosylformimino-5-aminoimidazole carboxamide ribotide isomerase